MDIKQLLAEKTTGDVETILHSSSIRETAGKLLEHRIGALLVTDEQCHIRGIVSERDLVQVVASRDVQSGEAPVSKIMTRSVVTCGPTDEVASVLRLMNSKAIRHLPVIDDGKLVSMVSIRELTTAYEMLQIEANTDPLTELSNRRPFLKTLSTEFDRAERYRRPMSVAMIDIDHFKSVNDTLGHDAGDKVLQGLASLLLSDFRNVDMVGRLGGEEFAEFGEVLECLAGRQFAGGIDLVLAGLAAGARVIAAPAANGIKIFQRKSQGIDAAMAFSACCNVSMFIKLLANCRCSIARRRPDCCELCVSCDAAET